MATVANPNAPGNAATFIVFTLPIKSIRKPAINEPTGTMRTTIDAASDVNASDTNGMPLFLSSICGIKTAE